jgi:outer membrane protein assembly factor BamB
MPIVIPDDRLLVSSGYGVGSALLRIQRDPAGAFSATRLWKTTRLKAKFTNLIYRDGFIYGLDDGVMVCLDAANGEQRWKKGRYGHGQEILVGDVLLVTAESGEIILLDPNPQASRELTRFSALRGRTWNPPGLAGEYLLVRNDREAACYRLPLAPLPRTKLMISARTCAPGGHGPTAALVMRSWETRRGDGVGPVELR